MRGIWVPHDTRDQVIDFLGHWSAKSEIPVKALLPWLELPASKYPDWKGRYGRANQHNGLIPRDHGLEDWEKRAMISFHEQFSLEGSRRLAFMMLDHAVVAASPSSVYRVLKAAGLRRRWNAAEQERNRFRATAGAHEHWHVDISYVNIHGTFYYLCSLLDGASRFIVHWELWERMTEADVEIVIQRAREKFSGARPQIISDNGPQFIAKDFKEFIRICGMTHVRTLAYYPQSNGKLERWHRTIKSQCLRPGAPLSVEDARRLTQGFVEHYNNVRLHSAIGYITPRDMLEGRAKIIHEQRDCKLKEARERRRIKRLEASRNTMQMAVSI
jgi:putative transposase